MRRKVIITLCIIAGIAIVAFMAFALISGGSIPTNETSENTANESVEENTSDNRHTPIDESTSNSENTGRSERQQENGTGNQDNPQEQRQVQETSTTTNAEIASAIDGAVSTQNGYSIDQSRVDEDTAQSKFPTTDASVNFLADENDEQLATGHISDFMSSLSDVSYTDASSERDEYVYVTRTYTGTITGDYTRYTTINVSGQRGSITIVYVIQTSDMRMVSASITDMSATQQQPSGAILTTSLMPD